MAQSAPKIHASTQAFTEIADIIDDVVLFTNSHAAMVIEVSSTNFALLSSDEQDARIGAYAAFLNSLTFPIQILAINKHVDITSYLTLLDEETKKASNDHARAYMQSYKNFVAQLVKENTVLDKHFYIIIPYAIYESGMGQTVSSATKGSRDELLANAKAALHTKADGVRNQLSRINLPTKVLTKNALIELFAQGYGQEMFHVGKEFA